MEVDDIGVSEVKFSVIVPVFNAERYLRHCLDSVANQVAPDWECICVDDGSTDRSPSILEEYAAKDSRFKVVRQANSGVGAARNVALGKAEGEWIVFLDADDMLRSTLMSSLHEAERAAPDANMIGFGISWFADSDSPVWKDADEGTRVLDCSLRLEHPVPDMGMWQYAYRRSRFESVRFGDLVMGEDLVFMGECLCLADKVAIIGMCGYGYRLSGGSACRSEMTPRKIIDMMRCRENIFRVFAQAGKELPTGYVRAAGNQWIETIPSLFMCRLREDYWSPVWKRWLDSMKIASTTSALSPWQRFVAFAVTSFRIRSVAWLLCVLPYRIKAAGFHR